MDTMEREEQCQAWWSLYSTADDILDGGSTEKDGQEGIPMDQAKKGKLESANWSTTQV